MKKNLLNIIFLSCLGITSYKGFSQTTPVKITVDWEDKSYENRVVVQDPGFQDILTIENPDEPYTTAGTSLIYTGVYNLGCIQSGTYKVILFNANNMPWASPGSITVTVDGITVVSDTGALASTAGYEISFNVSSDGSSCSPLPDSDGDGVIDVIDLDDDNDGIIDTNEALGINVFDCTIPALNFFGGSYESGGIGAGTLGAIYRFPNAIFLEPYDVLVEIVEMRNTTLSTIDDDTVDNPNYLQARPVFTGNEKPTDCVGCDYPGITFKFTIVDVGTSTPTATLFRIGGTTWDVDGPAERKESVRYYNPSAYGIDNPSTIDITDVNGDASEIEMTAGGILEGPGFSTLPQLRAYFQFLSNTFTLRMQNVRTTYNGTNTREYGMSFTQCDVLDFKSASLVIVNGTDSDGDGLDNHVDFDADNDGIPDNVEAQVTTGYIMPSATIDVNPITGLDVNYDPTALIPGTEIIPVDTDGDGICDFMDPDSDNDGIPDIEENGMANSIITFMDSDSDGLDNLFEGSNLLDNNDVNDEIDNPSSSILPDTDGDLLLGGDLDYRDAIDVFIESASVDFDGIDDHIAETAFMGGWPVATTMAWIKLDPTFSANGDVAGQGLMRMYVNGTTKKLHSYYITSVGSSAYGSSSVTTLDTDQWYHVAISYEGASGMTKLYVNGELENSGTIPVGTLSTNPIYADPDFNIGRHSRLDNSYFKGAIDEVRVFNTVLTEDQLQQMVYQEIEQDGANVKGGVLDKGIMDIATTSTIPWVNLQAYYPMTNILTGKTTDASSYGRDGTLKNIFTVQAQTAPMPYETTADGPWTTEGTWLHGDVWDIEDVAKNKDWSIVHVKNDLTTSASHTQLGMLIDSGSSLTVSGDNAITNNWLLQLDGTLDLADDSQLIQSRNSDLVTSATGKILRRQEGNNDFYWYNYWSSPVGITGATALSDNNRTSNNTNNSPFNIDMLMDGIGTTAMQFTSAYDEVGKISDRWLYSFQNGITYTDWVTLAPASDILPGVGYTQKGSGIDTNPDPLITEQQYTFVGKPNNGTILIPATDVPDAGNESEQDVTLTTTLIGNPYPSALDADEFIRDNIDFDNGGLNPIIQGTILLWEQWAGTSHWLAEYEGGYGYINLTEAARAYQHPDIVIADPTNPDNRGIKTPTKFIPVGQAFFVEVVNNGNIEFNNGQRVFKQESLNESVFFRETQSQDNTTNEELIARDGETTVTGPMQTIKLEFGVSNGASRQFVLGFSETTTDGFDPGYDGGLITQTPNEDMTSILDGKPYVIQAFSPISPEKEIDLYFNSSGNNNYTLDIAQLNNIDENQDVFVKDNHENITWDLRQGAYSFTALAGENTERFDIVFQDDNTLSNEDTLLEDVVIFVKNTENTLFVKGLDQEVKTLSLTNMLGQTVKTFNNIESNVLENGIYIGELSSGVYFVNLTTENNVKRNKKIILK